MTRAEGGLVPSGEGYGEGCLLFRRLGGLGERRELPQQGPGRSPGRKRILAYFDIHDLSVKILPDCPRGTPPSGELNTRGVAEYSDFGPIQRYISETVQDRR